MNAAFPPPAWIRNREVWRRCAPLLALGCAWASSACQPIANEVDAVRLACGGTVASGMVLLKFDKPGAGAFERTDSAYLSSPTHGKSALAVSPKGCVSVPREARGKLVVLNKDKTLARAFDWGGSLAAGTPLMQGLLALDGVPTPQLRCPARTEVNEPRLLFALPERDGATPGGDGQKGGKGEDWRVAAHLFRLVSVSAANAVLVGEWEDADESALRGKVAASASARPSDGRYLLQRALRLVSGVEIASGRDCIVDLDRTPPRWEPALPASAAPAAALELGPTPPGERRYACVHAEGVCAPDQFQAVGESLVLPVAGRYHVSTYVEDAHGNRGEIIRSPLLVDGSPPVVTVELLTPHAGETPGTSVSPGTGASPGLVRPVTVSGKARTLTFRILATDDVAQPQELAERTECRILLHALDGTALETLDFGVSFQGASSGKGWIGGNKAFPCKSDLTLWYPSNVASGVLTLEVRSADLRNQAASRSFPVWLTEDGMGRGADPLWEVPFLHAQSAVFVNSEDGAFWSAIFQNTSEGTASVLWKRRAPDGAEWGPSTSVPFPEPPPLDFSESVRLVSMSLQERSENGAPVAVPSDAADIWFAHGSKLHRMRARSAQPLDVKRSSYMVSREVLELGEVVDPSLSFELVRAAADPARERLLVLAKGVHGIGTRSACLAGFQLLAFDGTRFTRVADFMGRRVRDLEVSSTGEIHVVSIALKAGGENDWDAGWILRTLPEAVASGSGSAAEQASTATENSGSEWRLPENANPFAMTARSHGVLWMLLGSRMLERAPDGTLRTREEGLDEITRRDDTRVNPMGFADDGKGGVLWWVGCQLYRFEGNAWVRKPACRHGQFLGAGEDRDGLLHVAAIDYLQDDRVRNVSVVAARTELWNKLLPFGALSPVDPAKGVGKLFPCWSGMCWLRQDRAAARSAIWRLQHDGWGQLRTLGSTDDFGPLPPEDATGDALGVAQLSGSRLSRRTEWSSLVEPSWQWNTTLDAGARSRRVFLEAAMGTSQAPESALFWSATRVEGASAPASPGDFVCTAPAGFEVETAFIFTPVPLGTRSLWLLRSETAQGDGSEAYLLNPAGCVWTKLASPALSVGESVTAVARDAADQVWLGTSHGRLLRGSLESGFVALPLSDPAQAPGHAVPLKISKILTRSAASAPFVLFTGPEGGVGRICDDGRLRILNGRNSNLPLGDDVLDAALGPDGSLYAAAARGLYLLRAAERALACE